MFYESLISLIRISWMKFVVINFSQFFSFNLFCGSLSQCSDYYHFTPCEFFPPVLIVSFQWIWSDSKSPQISRTLLNILVDFSNAIVWMSSILLLIFNSLSLFPGSRELFLGLQLRLVSLLPPCSTGSPAKSSYLSSFSLSFIYSLLSSRMVKSTRWRLFFFMLINIRSDPLDLEICVYQILV